MRSRRLAALALLACACGPAPAESEAPPPTLPFALPIAFSAEQRTSVDVPGTAGLLGVELGDITGGQVQLRVTSPGLPTALAQRSLGEGEALDLQLQGVPLRLVLVELDNSLLGTDTAELRLERADGDAALDVGQQVERLLSALEACAGCVFLRNGDEHTPAEAADHLRRKFAWARDEVGSVDDFIAICATKSSLSGEQYRVRLGDGRELPSAQYLRELDGSVPASR